MSRRDDDIDVWYACAINKEQNIIATTIFSRHVDETHLIVKTDADDQSACDGTPRHREWGKCMFSIIQRQIYWWCYDIEIYYVSVAVINFSGLIFDVVV